MAVKEKQFHAVMLIDDNDIDNLINQKMIEAAGITEHIFSHTGARSAIEFLKNLEQLNSEAVNVLPEVIFLDIDMPLMDGFQFLEAYEADLKTDIGSRDKLGSISWASVVRGKFQITVVNGYTQYSASGNGVLVDYDAILTVMKEVKNRFSGERIGYPMIGAGLARGDWSIISEIITEQLDGEDHTLVKYVP